MLATQFPRLIVVGGVDSLGNKSPSAQTAPFVKVTAVDTRWLCPTKFGGYDYVQGTSGGRFFYPTQINPAILLNGLFCSRRCCSWLGREPLDPGNARAGYS